MFYFNRVLFRHWHLLIIDIEGKHARKNDYMKNFCIFIDLQNSVFLLWIASPVSSDFLSTQHTPCQDMTIFL